MFWKTFGLNPEDVDAISPKWKRKMTAIHEMKNKAQIDKMNEKSK